MPQHTPMHWGLVLDAGRGGEALAEFRKGKGTGQHDSGGQQETSWGLQVTQVQVG